MPTTATNEKPIQYWLTLVGILLGAGVKKFLGTMALVRRGFLKYRVDAAAAERAGCILLRLPRQ